MVILIIFFLLFYYCSSVYSVKEPTPPQAPKIEENAKPTNSISPIKKIYVDKEKIYYPFYVEVRLANSTIMTGVISFPEKSITVKHVKKGILFKKKLNWGDISFVEIKKWNPFLFTNNTNKKVLGYIFYPVEFCIITRKKEKYFYKGRIKYIEKFLFSNQNGSCELYSYFVDYWKIIKKDKGYWKNSKTSYFYFPFKHPLKNVVTRIVFLK